MGDDNEFLKRSKLVPGGCQVWLGIYQQSTGYGLHWNGNAWVYAHRHSLSRSLGRPIEFRKAALHTCNNKACVSPDHLYEGDAKSNAIDRVITQGGFGFARTKLAPVDVNRIRYAYRNFDMTQNQLGRMFGVSRGCIAHIINNRSWAHLEAA